MAHTNIRFPDNMRRFSHGLDAQNPFLIYRGNMRSDESHFIGDTHLDPQLFIVVSGEVDFHLDDHMFKGKAGDIFISNFWEPHAFRKTTPELNFIVVTFSLFSIGSGMPFSDFDWLLFMKQPASARKAEFAGEDKENILLLAQKIIKLETEQSPGFQSMLWLTIHEILYHINLKYISKHKVSLKKRTDTQLFPALELIRLNPDREIPLDEAAAACCMSRSAFCLAFKKVMNESFSHFAMKKRISYACMLLESGKYSIKEVSDMCGFSNVTHFYHTFKKFQNRTPGNIRKI